VIHKSIFRPKIIMDATTSRNLWKFLESFLTQNKPMVLDLSLVNSISIDTISMAIANQ